MIPDLPENINWSKIPGAMDPATVPGVGHAPVIDGPSGPQAAPPPKGQPIIFPWWLWEMPGSSDWELNSQSFSAVASTTTAVPNFTFNSGVGNVGVCAWIQITVQSPTTALNLKFRLLVNGAPVQGWSNIYIPALSAAAFVQPFNGMVVRFDENQNFTADVTEASGTAFTVALQARGWTTPKNVVKQFSSGIPY